jgi:hypothetical protein
VIRLCQVDLPVFAVSPPLCLLDFDANEVEEATDAIVPYNGRVAPVVDVSPVILSDSMKNGFLVAYYPQVLKYVDGQQLHLSRVTIGIVTPFVTDFKKYKLTLSAGGYNCVVEMPRIPGVLFATKGDIGLFCNNLYSFQEERRKKGGLGLADGVEQIEVQHSGLHHPEECCQHESRKPDQVKGLLFCCRG